MSSRLVLTEKGKKWLAEQEKTNPEINVLRGKMSENLPGLPSTRKELLAAVYKAAAEDFAKKV